MATTNDIDTKTAVRKFLEQRIVVDKEDKTADSSDEIQSILESVALSFLLYPQASLSFLLRAKNILQQIASTDLEIASYMLSTLDEVNNPDEPITDTSDLIEAQSALVEVDRIGRVGSDVLAYDRYNKAIERFLDKKLSKTLKRHKRGELERTGQEAKEDLFNVLGVFADNHNLLIDRMVALLSGVNNFRSVDLTKLISAQVLTRVRSSLKKVLDGAENQQLSKTSIAIELLAGAAALSSISDSRDVFDPTVETGILPSGRSIQVRSESVSAVALGTDTEVDLSAVSTPWIFNITVDPQINSGTNYAVTIPHSSASGRAYVKSAAGPTTYNISTTNKTLYVQFDGIAPPSDASATVVAVVLPTGSSVSISSVLTALNNVSTGLLYGTAVEMVPGSGRILIYGTSSVTKITILDSVFGSYNGSYRYVEAAGSVHSVLRFTDQQMSGNPNKFTPIEISDILATHVSGASIEVVEDKITITSDSADYLSSLSFGSGVASKFGFSTSHIYESNPTYLELIESGEALFPVDLGVFVGSIFSVSDLLSEAARNLFSEVTEIDGTQIKFNPLLNLPRGLRDVKITSPLVFKVQNLLDLIRPFATVFDSDFNTLRQVLTPILSNPTLAQISDAKKALVDLKVKIQNLLSSLESVIVRDDQKEFQTVASRISTSLEERGLDRGLELLQYAKFSDFFALTGTDASKSSRFLKATEQVGRNELSTTAAEQDIKDLVPKASTPDNSIITGNDPMEDEEQL